MDTSKITPFVAPEFNQGSPRWRVTYHISPFESGGFSLDDGSIRTDWAEMLRKERRIDQLIIIDTRTGRVRELVNMTGHQAATAVDEIVRGSP